MCRKGSTCPENKNISEDVLARSDGIDIERTLEASTQSAPESVYRSTRVRYRLRLLLDLVQSRFGTPHPVYKGEVPIDGERTLNDGQFDGGKGKDQRGVGRAVVGRFPLHGGISLIRKGITGVPVGLYKTTGGYQDMLFDR